MAQLECGHCFHLECIEWGNSRECSVCQQKFRARAILHRQATSGLSTVPAIAHKTTPKTAAATPKNDTELQAKVDAKPEPRKALDPEHDVSQTSPVVDSNATSITQFKFHCLWPMQQVEPQTQMLTNDTQTDGSVQSPNTCRVDSTDAPSTLIRPPVVSQVRSPHSQQHSINMFVGGNRLYRQAQHSWPNSIGQSCKGSEGARKCSRSCSEPFDSTVAGQPPQDSNRRPST